MTPRTGTLAAVLIALPVLGAVLAPRTVAAQEIRGRVLTWPDSTALPDARVTALDTLGDRRAHARTDPTGSFQLHLPETGLFRVRVTHPAHDTTVSRFLDVIMAEVVDVEVRVGPRPDSVPALAIRERDRSAWSYLRPYYRRLELFGDAEPEIFITREELDTLGVSTVGRAVLLAARPSSMRAPTARSCPPVAFWNGLRMSDRWHPFQSEAGRASVAGVEGIEIYHARHPRMPMNIRGEPCGAILIWTQPGPGRGGGLSDLLKAAAVLVVGVVLLLSIGS